MRLPNMKGYKGFIAGAAVTAILAMPFSSFAASLQKSVTATLAGIKVVVNGQTVTLKDGTGKSVEPLNYNGSVYVPVRSVSEMLGAKVGYDNSSKTVSVTTGGTATGTSATTGTGTPGATGGTMPGTQGGQPPQGAPGGMGTGGSDTSNRVTDVAASIASDMTTSAALTNSSAQTAKVAELAQAFMSTLTDDQKKQLSYDLTAENAAVWSNLPAGAAKRNGLMFGSLSTESLNALKALLAQALGEGGYEQLKETILADEYLSKSNSSMWDSDFYYVAFLGTPSDSSTWILQVSGHHYASNITYNGKETSATPVFLGVEPQSFTYDNVDYQPLASRRDAMYNMIKSLSAAQLNTAKISSSFDDVLVGPGQDGKFPTSEGIAVSSLTDEQKQLVKDAITAWVKDTSPNISTELLNAYLSDEALSQTKIGWSGSTDYSKSGSYIRIDGPRVWIEFVCQNGVAYPDQIHFHTVWRDKLADYGGSFSG